MSVVFVQMERKIFEFSFKVGLLLSLVRRREWGEGRRGGVWVSKVPLRASLGPFVPQKVHACVHVGLMDIGKWFQGGFWCCFPSMDSSVVPDPSLSPPLLEQRRRGRTAEPNPLWTEPPGPWQVALCNWGREKKKQWLGWQWSWEPGRTGGVSAWPGQALGLYAARAWGFLDGGGGRKLTQREKGNRTLGEVWHSAENERRVNGEHQRGR